MSHLLSQNGRNRYFHMNIYLLDNVDTEGGQNLWLTAGCTFHQDKLVPKTSFSLRLIWLILYLKGKNIKWTASSEFGTYRVCEQRRFRQNLRCSLIQAVSQEEPSDRKPDPRPLWMAGHAQLKFVMSECSKTQIRLTGLKWFYYSSSDIFKKHVLRVTSCYELSPVTRKPAFGDLRPGKTQTCPLSYRDKQSLEILDLASIGIVLSMQRKNKSADQSAQMCRLIYAFVVRICHKASFLMTWLNCFHVCIFVSIF